MRLLLRPYFAFAIAVLLSACGGGGSTTPNPSPSNGGGGGATTQGYLAGSMGGVTSAGDVNGSITGTVKNGVISGTITGTVGATSSSSTARTSSVRTTQSTSVTISGSVNGTISGNSVTGTVTGTTANGATFTGTLSGSVTGTTLNASASATFSGAVTGSATTTMSGTTTGTPLASGNQIWAIHASGGCGSCTGQFTAGSISVSPNGSFNGKVFSLTQSQGSPNGQFQAPTVYCVNIATLTGAFSGSSVSWTATTVVGPGSTDAGCSAGTGQVTGSGTANAAYPAATSVTNGTFTTGPNTGSFTMTLLPADLGYQSWSVFILGGCGSCNVNSSSGTLTADATGAFSGSVWIKNGNYVPPTPPSTTASEVYCNISIALTGAFSTSASSLNFSGTGTVAAGSTAPGCSGGTASGSLTTDQAYPNATYAYGSIPGGGGSAFLFRGL